MTDAPNRLYPEGVEAFEASDLNVDVLPDGSCVPAINDDALWALASTLHSNVPEADRPMSWSDYSPEQIERLRLAAKAFLGKYRTGTPAQGSPSCDDILSVLHTYRDHEPEEDESWESWYYAAFDLACMKIQELFGKPAVIYPPAKRCTCPGESDETPHDGKRCEIHGCHLSGALCRDLPVSIRCADCPSVSSTDRGGK